MFTGKIFYRVILYLIILNVFTTPSFALKSVYVVSDTYTSELRAYKIEGSTLVYQTNYSCLLNPSGEYGSVGVAIDESGYCQL
ncbi:hypothetical protein ES703_36594 [subsurface metagenome]